MSYVVYGTGSPDTSRWFQTYVTSPFQQFFCLSVVLSVSSAMSVRVCFRLPLPTYGTAFGNHLMTGLFGARGYVCFQMRIYKDLNFELCGSLEPNLREHMLVISILINLNAYITKECFSLFIDCRT